MVGSTRGTPNGFGAGGNGDPPPPPPPVGIAEDLASPDGDFAVVGSSSATTAGWALCSSRTRSELPRFPQYSASAIQ